MTAAPMYENTVASSDKNKSWAHALPNKQGLYDPALEHDACGVGFIANIKGQASHHIVQDARSLLCNMTHRGAVGADTRDGDGAGVMTGIPDKLLRSEFMQSHNIELPYAGEYATGNFFFSSEDSVREESMEILTSLAESLDLNVLAWRKVPVDSSIIGPAALSLEPIILQPIIVLISNSFDEIRFKRQLYIFEKLATRKIGYHRCFYICSLSTKSIVYKGQLAPVQVYNYFYDLNSAQYESHFALVHSRFSTNTFPSWDRAQPLRYGAHNGEINTLKGNINWMEAREGQLASEMFGDDMDSLYPIVAEGGSDSSSLDNVLELLITNGKMSLPEAIMMLVPEAWQGNPDLDPDRLAFYRWASCLMEPWDGPCLFLFSDGRYCGANLDRNGLRPCRYYLTSDDTIICASEVGTIIVDPAKVIYKGRVQPGRTLVVDTKEARIIGDKELKDGIARRYNFREWVKRIVSVQDLRNILSVKNPSSINHSVDELNTTEDERLIAFGYTLEQINMILAPMGVDGKEALGSMGNDATLACLSTKPRLIYDYFRQLFAQVTNPPIDPIRESIVMSLECYVCSPGNLLDINEDQCNSILLKSPILNIEELNVLKYISQADNRWRAVSIDLTFPKTYGPSAYLRRLNEICEEAQKATEKGYQIIVLSDRLISAERVTVSALAACGAVHNHLVKERVRTKAAIIIETGEAREVHHFCVLLGYGADAICPYLALEALMKLQRENALKEALPTEILVNNFQHAADAGILKVMSKMGISTLQSYKGAMIFEALGIGEDIIEKCFPGTASRIGGIDFNILALESFRFHSLGYFDRKTLLSKGLPESGEYHWRDGGDSHINTPTAIASLQDAVRTTNQKSYDTYRNTVQKSIEECTLRGMLDFNYDDANEIPLSEVEPWTNIVKRFCTGAMSYGSISEESHKALAIAMNRLGGKSNTGEGGEDAERSKPFPNGDSTRSSIKQIASGRFGVTSFYLSDADELQIKMAQGAKPGEGGELPGHKVSETIAKTRHSTPGVGLISPPPHHDIYSIEDLKQLIYDLKCSSPKSRVSVKLVSEVGVGIVAAGVAKAKADHILISGHDGGTGASRWTGIKYAGLPWELGLAEAHQTLVLNDLRGRVTLQTDGQLKTGRDIAIACLLGAEEWGFATTPLITLGCIMMRKCHLNSCPVGLATQDPELRAKFQGQPEHVINFFYYVAEEMRTIMAKLGFRTINEMVGRSDLLKVNQTPLNDKAKRIDLSAMLIPAYSLRPGAATYNVRKQDHRLYIRLDNMLIEEADWTFERGTPSYIECEIVNTERAFGTTLSYRISRRYGEKGLPEDSVHVKIFGSAGQSFAAFLAPGITFELEGDCNDYVAKGLSGGKVIVYPPKDSSFKSEENVIVGNVCLYGATSGECFIRGIAAERFCVRNSGAIAVVEGVGDHGCEYMTGGRVIVLGGTGRNFAAGMSGGIAYVLNQSGTFEHQVNQEMVSLEDVTDKEEIDFIKSYIQKHVEYTGSPAARRILDSFDSMIKYFTKTLPLDYKRVLEAEKAKVSKPIEMDINEMNYDYPTAKVVNGSNGDDLSTKVKVMDLEDSVLDDESEKRKAIVLDKTKGFIKYSRREEKYRSSKLRVRDWAELSNRLSDGQLKVQTARCMDCGVPFCQSDTGCPISNIIPKWNELVFKGQWKNALDRLLMTNPFPEFTGRVCPAPCEGACTLGIIENPVGIKSVERAIIDRAFENGWIVPRDIVHYSGMKVAVVGSGPAGLAAADALNRAGHLVTVYERADRAGGLLMYGIPNMKLDKQVLQRRINLLKDEGITFQLNVEIGSSLTLDSLRDMNDAVILAIGSTIPRDLNIPNRQLTNIIFAMQFLTKNTKSLLDSKLQDEAYISARDKNVIVVGGGDTGNDCIGTALRHGAKSVINFELLPEPPATRAMDNPWPQFPRVFKVDYGHNECISQFCGDPREYCILSKSFESDEDGNVVGINTVRVSWMKDERGGWIMSEVPGSEQFFEADLVILALGFVGPENSVSMQTVLETDKRGNIWTPEKSYRTNVERVYAAGDCRRGQSLVVWGIREGLQCARQVDADLMQLTLLGNSGGIVELPLNPGAHSQQRQRLSEPIQA